MQKTRDRKRLDQLKIKHDREDEKEQHKTPQERTCQSTTDLSLINIHKKRQRIKQGSGEKMRKVGDKWRTDTRPDETCKQVC